MKNKKNLMLLVLSVLFVSGFLLLNKTNSIKKIKVKELNYNVTYKTAFPDPNIRRSIILCIMRNMCGEEQYNSGAYEYKKYNEILNNPGAYDYFITNYTTEHYVENKFGPVISEEEIISKENEILNQEDLNKLEVLTSNNYYQDITSLQGVEYLPNLKAVVLGTLAVENPDFSHNTKLEKIYFNVSEHISNGFRVKTLKVAEDNKINTLFAKLGSEDADISNLKKVEEVILKNSKLKSIILPNSIKKLDLSYNKISSIVLPETVEDVNLSSNNITNIKIPSKVVKAVISTNKITNIDLTNSVNLEELIATFNPIKNIDLTKAINLKKIDLFRTELDVETIDFSKNPKLEKVTLHFAFPMPHIPGMPKLPEVKIKTLDFSNNPNLMELSAEKVGLTTLNLGKNLKLEYANINNNEIKDLKIPTTLEESTVQNINFKIKKNSYIDLPILFNGEKLYLEDSNNFKRVKDEYIFDQVGIFNEKVKKEITDGYKYEANVTVEVESGEEETYIPTLSNQVDYKPESNKELSVDKIKEMVNNLPANIKNFEIISPEDKKFTSEGDKKVKVRVTLSDDTFKEFDIDIKVYEEKVILPEITVTKPVENKKPERGYYGFRKANKRVRRSLDKYNEVNESVKELEKLIEDSKNNNFETKEETDVENLKNNILVKIEDAKERLKKSYTEETEEEKLIEIKEKVLKEIEGLKEELNKIREKQVSNNEEKVEKPTLLKENKKQDTKSFNYFLILIPVSLIILILILLKRRKKER